MDCLVSICSSVLAAPLTLPFLVSSIGFSLLLISSCPLDMSSLLLELASSSVMSSFSLQLKWLRKKQKQVDKPYKWCECLCLCKRNGRRGRQTVNCKKDFGPAKYRHSKHVLSVENTPLYSPAASPSGVWQKFSQWTLALLPTKQHTALVPSFCMGKSVLLVITRQCK